MLPQAQAHQASECQLTRAITAATLPACKLTKAWDAVHAGSGPKLVQMGIDQVMNVLKEREQQMLITLLVALSQQGVVSQPDFLTGLHTYTDQLEDLRCAAGCACLSAGSNSSNSKLARVQALVCSMLQGKTSVRLSLMSIPESVAHPHQRFGQGQPAAPRNCQRQWAHP